LIDGDISSKNAQSLLSDRPRRGGTGIKGEEGGGIVKIEMNERVVPIEGITKGY
jgi:hypothetical protein